MPSSSVRKRPVNLSLSPELVAAAREFNINVSETCERALAAELKKVREERWLAENRAALEAWNEWVERNGLPYEEFRPF